MNIKRREFITKTTIAGLALGTATPLWSSVAEAATPSTTLVRDGKTQYAIFASPETMAADKPISDATPYAEHETEMQRRRLRDSANDLARCLGIMSRTAVEVNARAPQKGDVGLPIFIGEYAVEKWGQPKQKSPFKQGWRMVIAKNGIGLMGETGESASYAVYELLDRLGCRWFVPGAMGEVIPQSQNIRLSQMDISGVPSTAYRSIWYGDEDFKRRNRMGGFNVKANQILEYYITPEQRLAHPEWRAIINGKPDEMRLKWSNPEVSDAVADAIIAKLDKKYQPSIDLSPADGDHFDESDDTKLDAGDWDTSMDTISITDRLINFCNRIAERVTKKYPDVRFGLLAYVQYTRPPLREKIHPNIDPEIAPITYCRAHAMTDTHICPSRPKLRPIVEGWGKVAPGRVAYYNYMFHLAEVTVPYPMMHQMSEELPILYANGIQFWQPETMPNFDSVLPGMWLTLRMSWNSNQQPAKIFDDFFEKFYGAAQKPMRRYWQTFDDAWTNVDEHAGCGFGHMKRFTPEVMSTARAAMNDALFAVRSSVEYQRVKIQDESLRQFERFMQLRWDLAEGRLAQLEVKDITWLGTQVALGNEYENNFAFTKITWNLYTVGGMHFKEFFEKAYLDAARLMKTHSVIGAPLREWKYQVVKKENGDTTNWQAKEFDDAAWTVTDSAVETWSDLGLLMFYGKFWYRQKVNIPAIPAGKKVLLWIASTDGSAKVFVNGQHISYLNEKGEKSDEASGYCQPFSFDVTAALAPGAENQITIETKRLALNELGTGGLLGPAYLMQEN